MGQNLFNHPIFTTFLARMTLRNKLILTALIAFLFGVMIRGGGGTVGRYQFSPGNSQVVIDTQTGETFEKSEGGRFTRTGSLPWH